MEALLALAHTLPLRKNDFPAIRKPPADVPLTHCAIPTRLTCRLRTHYCPPILAKPENATGFLSVKALFN